MNYLKSLTINIYIIFLLIFVILFFGLLAIYFIKKRKFLIKLKSNIENWNSNKSSFVNNFSDITLLFYANFIEKLSIKYGINLPVLLALNNLWINQIKKKGTAKTIKRVLKYSPDKGLFTIMNAVLHKPRLRPVLLDWIDKSGEFMVLRKIALSGMGETFDGKEAYSLFNKNIDEINELMGDFEWKSRYFAINILIHDKGKRSKEAVWESFRDPSVYVRITSVEKFSDKNREKIYDILESLVLNDPSFKVRKAAKIRISKDFPDLYNTDPFKLDITQQLHLIELLNPDSKQDENIAIEFMKTGNKELELYASRFLHKNGSLKRLFLSADQGYAKGFEDTYSILKIAIGVDCTHFMELSGSDISTGAILLASRILIDYGDREIITDLLKKTLELTKDRENIELYKEIYENSILCVCSRGNDKALDILDSEIKRRRYDKNFQKWVLTKIPADKENIFVPTMLDFLKDSKYDTKDNLGIALLKFPVASFLADIIDILKIENTHNIHVAALKILGALQLPHCTQYILENLSILPLKEAKQYSLLLSKNRNSSFNDKVKNILSYGDSSSMAHLIAALPESECKIFLPEIKHSLKDSNPEVRIASVWALSDYNKGEFLSLCFDLLKDPVENVRKEVGKTLGSIGNTEILSVLKQTLFDQNESYSVKNAVLHGLKVSKSPEVLNILLLKLEESSELINETITALSTKDSQSDISKILSFMDKTTPSVRTNIIKAIRLMNSNVELLIEKLLVGDSKILHKHAVAILEDSGLIDLRIRQLAHRDPLVRRKAAEFLLNTGTKDAFRGIILAAKDPDNEVRIQVVKALDKMNAAHGLAILEELKNDPEKRVRKYTLWAMERYEAKNLV
jgi:HEAT repeat protein